MVCLAPPSGAGNYVDSVSERMGCKTHPAERRGLSRRLILHKRRRRACAGQDGAGLLDNCIPYKSLRRVTLRKSLVLGPAVLLLLALFGLIPTFSFAQDEFSTARLNAITLAPDPNAAASPSSPAAPPKPQPASPVPGGPEGPRRIGVGVKLSLLGIGGEGAVALTKRINVRGGFNFFNYSDTFSKDGISYGAQLAFRSGEAHLDLFPFAGAFHVSPGLLFYNDNHIDATASVPGGQSFTLGGVSYISSATNPVSGTAKLGFNKVAPTLLIGFGNLIPRNRRRFSLTTEFGVAYTGAPKASLALQGTGCSNPALLCVNVATDPTVQSNVQSEVAKVNHDVSVVKIYPLASFGFAVNF